MTVGEPQTVKQQSMKLPPLPEQVKTFACGLVARGYEVWIIGSQVNPAKNPPSDWDFIIFGDENLINELSQIEPVPYVDPLVVYDGDNFRSPWPSSSDGEKKDGSLTSWKWKLIEPNLAQYEGTKWPADWGSTKRAIKIPRSGGAA